MSTENKTLAEQVAALETELAALKAKMAEPERGRWRPKNGERYSSILAEGLIRSGVWCGSYYDASVYELGNVYKTYEDAENAIRRRKLEVEWSDMAAATGFVPDWMNEDEDRCYAVFDHALGDVCVVNSPCCQSPGDVYFPSWRAIQTALKTFGKDKFKEMMGVE